MMNTSQIVTASDFREFVSNLATSEANAHPQGLSTYLRSLWRLIQENRFDPVTYALLAKMLLEAFTTEPLPFDEKWLAYEAPPKQIMSNSNQMQDEFGLLRNMILYQIADLHRFEQAGIFHDPSPIIFLGLKSLTCSSYWYNFSPESFLGNAISGLSVNSDKSECHWSDLAVLLWLGQMYE